MICFRKTIIGFVALYITTLSLYGQELRRIVEKEGDINKKTEYDLKLQFRNNLDTDIILDRADFGGKINYRISKKVSISGGLRYSIKNKGTKEENISHSQEKYRLTTDLKYKNKKHFKNLDYSNRLRFQYSIGKHQKEKYYIRDKLAFTFEFSKSITPFVAVEPYYSIDDQKLDVIRFYGGNEFELFNTEIELFFILQINNQKNNFNTEHIYGISFKF